MFNFLITASLLSGVIGFSLYNIYSTNSEYTNNISKSEEIKISQQRVNLSGSYSQTGNSSQSDVSRKINLSSLVEQKLSLKEMEMMDNFQKAVKKAIIENNIENPTCSDLEDTGFIKKVECDEIKEKINNFAKIDDGKIQINNSDISKIINNREHFNEKNINDDNSTTFITYDKSNLSTSKNILSKQISKNESFNKIIETINDEDELKDLAVSLIRKYELRGENDFFSLNRIEKVSNRIEYLKFKAQLDSAVENKVDSNVIESLKETYKSNLLNSESYFIENKITIDTTYLTNRLNELKQKLNY